MFRNKFLVPQRVASSASRYLSSSQGGGKLVAPPLVYISGEEYSRYAGELYMNEWIKPYVDTSKWEFYDLSCVSRDKTDDQVLKDCVKAGKRLGAIYKEPTITPTEEQAKQFGLKKAWGSPNGLMRKGWNGISISRYVTAYIIMLHNMYRRLIHNLYNVRITYSSIIVFLLVISHSFINVFVYARMHKLNVSTTLLLETPFTFLA